MITLNNIKAIAAICSLSLVTTVATQARELVSGYDFKTGSAIANNGGTSYASNFGDGHLYWDGTHGSSLWITYYDGISTPYQQKASNGTKENSGLHYGQKFDDTSTTSSNLSGFAIYQPAKALTNGVNANGKAIVFSFSMAGYEKLSLSYAGYFSPSGGFSDVLWEYSTDASTWSTIGTVHNTLGSYGTYTPFENLSGLDNAATAYIRATFSGAGEDPNADRLHVLDNFVFSAEAIPESSTIGMILMGAGALVLSRQKYSR